MNVTVYSTTTCPYCNSLKDYLQSHEISFTEKLVDQDESAQKEMIKNSEGFLGVPFTVVQKDDGSIDTIIGFDKGRVDKIFNISS